MAAAPHNYIRCSLKYPGRGFAIDTVALVYIPYGEWQASTKMMTAGQAALDYRLLAALLSVQLPVLLDRDSLLTLERESRRLHSSIAGNLEEAHVSACATLSGFLGQAAEQREAAAWFEECSLFEEPKQVWLAPGTDILADVIEINACGKREAGLGMA